MVGGVTIKKVIQKNDKIIFKENFKEMVLEIIKGFIWIFIFLFLIIGIALLGKDNISLFKFIGYLFILSIVITLIVTPFALPRLTVDKEGIRGRNFFSNPKHKFNVKWSDVKYISKKSIVIQKDYEKFKAMNSEEVEQLDEEGHDYYHYVMEIKNEKGIFIGTSNDEFEIECDKADIDKYYKLIYELWKKYTK